MLRNRRDLILLLLLTLSGGVAGGLFAVVVFPRLEPLPPAWIFLPGLVGMLYLVIVFHELGHLMAGLTQNFRFASLIAGPLWIENSAGRLRLRLNRSLALAGGIVSMLPAGDHDLRQRMMVLLAGGPGASLLLAAALLAAASDIQTDNDGRKVLKIPVLPPGSVRTTAPISPSHLSGEAVIATNDGKPWVARLKLRARENFKLNLLIKVTGFEQTFDYRIGPDGRPRLASQSADSRGSMFGFAGGQTDEVTYAYR